MLRGNFKFVTILLKVIVTSSNFRFGQPKEPLTLIKNTCPEIYLASYLQKGSFDDSLADNQFRNCSEFKNDFIHKFNKTDYIIQYSTRKVVFICQAKYPVIWYVPHLKQVENLPFGMFKTETIRVSDFDKVPKTKYFKTSLTINFGVYIRDVFSVNFTCRLTNANDKEGRKFPVNPSSSIHLYNFESRTAIENSGKVVEMKIPKNYVHDTITIPCRPSSPTASIIFETKALYNNITKGQDIIKWEKHQNFTYDPKNGFTVNKSNSRSIFEQYRCTLTEREGEIDTIKKEQVVVFNVTFDDHKPPQSALENIEFEPTLNLKGNAVVVYNNNSFGRNIPPRNFSTQTFGNPELLCCTGKNNVQPKMCKHKCSSTLECDILKRHMTYNVNIKMDKIFEYNYAINGHSSEDQNDCLSTTLYRGNVVVFCKGENVLFGDHLINLFNEKLLPVSNRPTVARQNLWTFEPESSKVAENISRRIFLTVGHPVMKNQEYEQSMEFTTFKHSDEHAEDSTQYVAEYSRDNFYVGEPLIPICMGWTSFYSHGAFVKIVFANGSNTILNLRKAMEPSSYLINFSGGLKGGRDYIRGDLIEYKLGKQVLAQKDMVYLECWMPQWKTEKWDKQKFELNILEPTKPRFFGNVEENKTTTYFDLGKENQTLEWRIIGGSPKPYVDVTIDGIRVFSQNFQDLDKDLQSYHTFNKYNLTVETENRLDDANGGDEIVKIKVWFVEITDDIQGIYQVNVTNVGGTVTHIFEVIVNRLNSNQTKQS